MSAALRALPPWLAFLPREGAEVCPCAVLIMGRWYSHSGWLVCRGSGQIVPQPAPRAEVR